MKKFLIVDANPSLVDIVVRDGHEAGLDVTGVVADSLQVVGKISPDGEIGPITNIAPEDVLRKHFDALFISHTAYGSSRGEDYREKDSEWIANATTHGADFSTTRIISISAFPEESKFEYCHWGTKAIVQKMRELAKQGSEAVT